MNIHLYRSDTLGKKITKNDTIKTREDSFEDGSKYDWYLARTSRYRTCRAQIQGDLVKSYRILTNQ